MKYIGEIAGVMTSLFYAINAVVVTKATEKTGAVITNRMRVAFGFLYLAIINLFLFRQPLPYNSGSDHWMWLSLSGIIGLALGDTFLYQTFVLVGARIGALLLSLSTVIGVLEAWLFFGETLRVGQMLGIALALVGIIWVVIERGSGKDQGAHHVIPGITFGILSAFCNATGLVLSRQGMAGNFSPFQANVIRMLAALLVLIIIMVFQKQTVQTFQVLRKNSSALRLLALAALIGPVLGVSSSLLAVQHTKIGVASVLTSLPPIFMLPISYFFFKERLSWQAIAGTILAMIGVAILFSA
ncbi:MAG: DMT family transporter [Anaerolineales bacterium]|nr:DMT family transporter [Anaerolineales bacterium]